MNSLIVFIFLIFSLATYVFIYVFNNKRDLQSKETMREVIRAIKSKDLEEYEQVLPPLVPNVKTEELKDQDEFEELYNVPPTDLLNAIRKE